ncbi:DUF2785 domain-containing protein [Kitasatospora camelliae]|uniref:DUF2785 domain-containing protein n=1 Tax=Kitasatospora camelliae TaxID=3156397 RepID=A0AAU8JWW6_9ACTN
MIDWTLLATLPPTPERIRRVSLALRSPDPAERDDHAYAQLCRWVPELDEPERRALGDAMAERFTDPEVQARTFAPLILTKIVEAGTYDPAWLAAFARWYPAETDLRGHDAELGWLHAVAHGADLLGAFGRCPGTDPVALLELAVARLLAPTDHVLDAMEDDRLGHAIGLALTRQELTEQGSTAWLEPIAAEFRAGRPGPVPAHASNTIRTLRVVYLLADRGVRPDRRGSAAEPLRHAEAVRSRVAEVLSITSPYAG